MNQPPVKSLKERLIRRIFECAKEEDWGSAMAALDAYTEDVRAGVDVDTTDRERLFATLR